MNVRKIREELNLSQFNLATMIGAHISSVQRWEATDDQPSNYFAREIFRVQQEIWKAREVDRKERENV